MIREVAGKGEAPSTCSVQRSCKIMKGNQWSTGSNHPLEPSVCGQLHEVARQRCGASAPTSKPRPGRPFARPALAGFKAHTCAGQLRGTKNKAHARGHHS